jgi:hypothetical protein
MVKLITQKGPIVCPRLQVCRAKIIKRKQKTNKRKATFNSYITPLINQNDTALFISFSSNLISINPNSPNTSLPVDPF